MARDKGIELAVVATAQTHAIGDSEHWYTLFNDDTTNDIYFRLKDENAMAGIAAVIVATPIFGARLKAGKSRIVKGGTWEFCCATGLTATCRIGPGMSSDDAAMADDIAALLASVGDTTGLVFSTVLITEAVAGVADLGVVANATDVIRLHGLYVTARAQCTVAVGYSDDVDGLINYVALTGPETVGAGGAPHPGPDDKDPRGKLSTIAHATAKHMVGTFVTAGGDGYAIISKGPA